MKRFIIPLIIACALLLGCTKKAQYYIDKGNSYLNENNYEEAVIEFTNAIEIDEKNIEALRGRASAYRNNEQYELAMNDYGSILLLDSADINDYDEAISLCLSEKNYEKATSIIEMKKSRFGETNLSEDDRKVISANKVINEFLAACEQGDHNEVERLFSQRESFRDLMEIIKETGRPIVVEGYEKSMGIYNVNVSLLEGREIESLMVYYGEFDNGLRNGMSYWYGDSYVAYGNWVNDFPNGEFTVSGLAGGSMSTRGEVINGLWEGTVERVYNGKTYNPSYSSGMVNVIRVVTDNLGRTYYDIAIASNGDRLATINIDTPRGIAGFGQILE